MSVAEHLRTLARAVAGSTRDFGRAGELARIGRVQDLTAVPGTIRGRVSQPSGDDDVTVQADPVGSDAWGRLVEAMAASVDHVATLARGELPPGSTLQQLLGEPLVPSVDDVRWTGQDPVLAAAVLLRIAATADSDLGLLLTWRGQSPEDLARAVREHRGVVGERVSAAEVDDPTRSPTGLPSGTITLAPPVEPEALVRSLGPDPVGGIASAVRAAAEFAWKVAAGAGQEAASDAVLLAELRGLGTATAVELADRLGIAEEETVEALAELHSQGRVLRAGSRYRAA